MKQRVTILLLAIAAFTIQTVTAQVLVKDIWPGGESSSPKEFFNLNGTVFFAGDLGTTGIELFKTDGTADGTVLVKDINPSGSSEPSWMAGSGGIMFFRASDGVHGDEVWVTDGTAEGTHMTKDIFPGTEGSHPEHVGMLDGKAYFMANDGVNGAELWVSDGTEEGTLMLMDINPGAESGSPHWFLANGDWLYFRANDGVHGDEIWRTNGTTIEMILDVYEGAEGSVPERFVLLDGLVYFPATHPVYGRELWVTDGTEEGTHLVKDVNTLGDSDPKNITVVGNQIFFAAENGITGSELWATDGTMVGTRLVKDIRAGDSPSLPGNFTAVGSTLFFSAMGDASTGAALWKSDGTEDGTVMVKDVRASGEPAFLSFTGLTGTGVMAFTANDGITGVELWRSDGTEAGTYVTRDISPGMASAAPLSLIDVNGVLYFSATDQVHGRELWTYDPNTPPDFPFARADFATTPFNTAVVIDVLANDSGDSIDISVVGDAENGTTSIVGGQDKSIRYTPDMGFVGTDTFNYTIEDGDGNTHFTVVTVTVLPVNSAPTISAIADMETDEDTPPGEIKFTVGDAQTAARELVVTASSDNQTLLPDANMAVEGGSSNRGLALITAPDQTGSVDITLTVSDGDLTASTTFTLTVNPVNDAPSIGVIADQTTAEDTATDAVAFTVADIDSPLSGLVVTAVSDNQILLPNANIALGGADGNRTVTMTPAADQAGLATVTLTVSDGALSSTRSFKLTVTAVDAPSITGLVDMETGQGVAITAFPFTVGDAVTDPADLEVTVTSSNQTLLPDANISLGGSGADRTVTLTPVSGLFGAAVLTFVVEDEDGNINSVQITLTVTSDNTAPVAVDDSYRVDDNTTLTVSAEDGLLANDTDVDGDELTAHVLAAPDHGVLSVNTDGSFSYIPDTQTGETAIQFTYRAYDGVFNSEPATVTMYIGTNLPPTITQIEDQEGVESDGVEITKVAVKDDISHGEGLTLTATSDNQALIPDENIEIHGGGDMRVIKITFANYVSGTANVTIRVEDEEGLSASTTFKVTVSAVNDAPTITAIEDQTTSANVATDAIGFIIADIETPSGSLILEATSDNQALLPNGNIVLGGTGAERTITLTPETDMSGSAIVTITVSDGDKSSSESFTLTVTSADSPTIESIANQTTTENTALGPIAFQVGDAVTPAADLVVTASSSDQTLLPDANIVLGGSGADRTITMTPATDESGSVAITVVVEDADEFKSSTTFVLTVGAANQPPVAMNEAYSMAEGGGLIVSAADGVLANDTDPNGDELTAILVDPPYAGTLVLNSDGSFTYEPPLEEEVSHKAGFTSAVEGGPPSDGGHDDGETEEPLTFTYYANDGFLNSNLATVTLLSEHGSAISQIEDQVSVEGQVIGPISFTVKPGKMTIMAHSNNQTLLSDNDLVIGGEGRNRTITMTPADGSFGKATVTIAATSGSTDMSFLVTVQSAKAPVISAIDDLTTHEGSGSTSLPFTLEDSDTNLNYLILSATSSNTTLLPEVGIVFGGVGGNRTITLNPANGELGSSNVSISVFDGEETTSESFVFTVVDAGVPVAENDSYELDVTTILVVNAASGVLANDWDPDDDPLTAVLVAAPSTGDLVLNPDGSFMYTPAGLVAGKATSILSADEPDDHDLFFTYQASDGSLLSAIATVSLTTEHTDELYISPIADQTVTVGSTLGPLDFTVTPGKSSISVSSSNTAFLPVENIRLSGMGRNRTVTLTPVANRLGWSDVTLTNTGESSSVSTTFRVRAISDRKAGDVNNDATVSVSDAVLMLRYIVQIDPEISVAADVNGEGHVNVSDVVTVLKYIVQIIDCFPVEDTCSAATATKNGDPGIPSPVLANKDAYEVIIPLVIQASETDGIELTLAYDASRVALASLDLDLPDGWMLMRNDVNGTLRVAAIGVDPVTTAEIGRVTLMIIDGGESSVHGSLRTSDGTEQAIEIESKQDLPVSFELEGNYPNPFNPTTTIRYALPEAADVRIEVFNSIGQRVSTLFSGRQEAGRHNVTVRADNWPTGIYFYRIQTEAISKTSSMLLVK